MVELMVVVLFVIKFIDKKIYFFCIYDYCKFFCVVNMRWDR